MIDPTYLAVVGVVFGLIFGSAINAFVWRLHAGRSWAKGRSECSDCGHPLQAMDLIPVLSWVALGGKCRYCRKPIKDHPIVELVTAIVLGTSWYVLAPVNAAGWLVLAFWTVLALMLIVLGAYDARWKLLPNSVVYPLILAAGLTLAAVHVAHTGRVAWIDGVAVLAALVIIEFDYLDTRQEWPIIVNACMVATLVAGASVLFAHGDRAIAGPVLAAVLAYAGFFTLVAATKGRGMGGGDVKLAFAMGLILGLEGTMVAMLIAFNVAAVVGLAMIATGKRDRQDQIPFGPYLVAGTIVAFLAGRQLVAWYLSLNGL